MQNCYFPALGLIIIITGGRMAFSKAFYWHRKYHILGPANQLFKFSPSTATRRLFIPAAALWITNASCLASQCFA
ncbi:hypothetical protein B0H19DRAFT_1110828 [Mycena capillaripes]|nr:hypothetical protein B0H19DRAFT_1110828 [Mycena capillaripes]